jgi:hypothetical protein
VVSSENLQAAGALSTVNVHEPHQVKTPGPFPRLFPSTKQARECYRKLECLNNNLSESHESRSRIAGMPWPTTNHEYEGFVPFISIAANQGPILNLPT